MKKRQKGPQLDKTSTTIMLTGTKAISTSVETVKALSDDGRAFIPEEKNDVRSRMLRIRKSVMETRSGRRSAVEREVKQSRPPRA